MAGLKFKVIMFCLFCFNPDKTHSASLAKQLHDQLRAIPPDLLEKRFLEKA